MQGKKSSPLDRLDDSLIPEPEYRREDIEMKQLPEEIDKEVLRRQRQVARILRRDLREEVQLWYDMATMPAEAAAIRVGSKKEADALVNKMYFARRQEEIRLELMEPGVARVDLTTRLKAVKRLALAIEQDKKGWFVLVYRKMEYKLEPYDVSNFEPE